MIRVGLTALAWFGFGVIAGEMFNRFELVAYKINVMGVSVSLTILFLASEVILHHFKQKAAESEAARTRYQTVLKHYRIIVGGLGVLVFFVIPFVWWKVIERLANLAGDGVRNF